MGVAAPGCSLLNVTVTGASGAYSMKGKNSCGDAEMWRSLCFQGTTLTSTFPVLNSHAHTYIHANWHAHTAGQMYRSAVIVISSTILCTYTEPEIYGRILWWRIRGCVGVLIQIHVCTTSKCAYRLARTCGAVHSARRRKHDRISFRNPLHVSEDVE